MEDIKIEKGETETISNVETQSDSDIIKAGDYVVIQKKDYFRFHQLTRKCNIKIGIHKVDLSNIIGNKYWSTFKLISQSQGNNNKGRDFTLELTDRVESIPEIVMKDLSSGLDNRNITDDGKSQLLSKDEIVGFRDSGLSATNIVEKLIESSTTFKSKTEYSQEKYLKKKEKKYFEYITVRKPSIRLIADILFKQDPQKILGLRYDSLAQLLSYANVASSGTYMLFENNTQSLVGSAILNCLNEGGRLINLTQITPPSKLAISSMNFTEEQRNRVWNVRIGDLLSALYVEEKPSVEVTPPLDPPLPDNDKSEDTLNSNHKRKHPDGDRCDEESAAPKKPKWFEAFHATVDLLKTQKSDGLIIVCKEYPSNIIERFLPFVKPSRQIVVYSLFREPLLNLFIELKKRGDVVGIHIYENWLRSHQILTDRTHPDVNMSANGGHLLVGTKVQC